VIALLLGLNGFPLLNGGMTPSTKTTPYEVLYGFHPPTHWFMDCRMVK